VQGRNGTRPAALRSANLALRKETTMSADLIEIPTLVTERLRLRPFRRTDIDDYAALYALRHRPGDLAEPLMAPVPGGSPEACLLFLSKLQSQGTAREENA
jgi:hypothetical protein